MIGRLFTTSIKTNTKNENRKPSTIVLQHSCKLINIDLTFQHDSKALTYRFLGLKYTPHFTFQDKN